jgi:sterol 24-C-methyltransferase
MASDSEHEPLIDNNPKLQSYYLSLESRIGYRLLLGGTQYFG